MQKRCKATVRDEYNQTQELMHVIVGFAKTFGNTHELQEAFCHADKLATKLKAELDELSGETS